MNYVEKFIHATLENGYCDGHFPGSPIVPAAVALGWVLQFLESKFSIKPDQTEIKNLKLLHEIKPPIQLTIRLEENDNGYLASLMSESIVYLKMIIIVTPD